MTMLAEREPVDTFGLTTYHATPALFSPPMVTAVSSAPQILPFAYMTCCIRVSFESGREIFSSWAGSPPKMSFQQPLPAMVFVFVSLMHRPCGVSVVGSVPEPGCLNRGGIAYWLTARTVLESVSVGVAALSDDVLVNDHATIWRDV